MAAKWAAQWVVRLALAMAACLAAVKAFDSVVGKDSSMVSCKVVVKG